MKTGSSTSKFNASSPAPRQTALLGLDQIEIAGELLRRGELVVIPTETVYGLAADATNGDAVRAIFTAKGRPQDNPLIVHVASIAAALAMVPQELGAARRALEACAPGPLTVVVPAPAGISAVVRGGLNTVALRVPSHPGARAIIAAAGVPIAAPSANRSGRPSPTSYAMARWEMEGRVSAIVDGGVTDIGIESTVVDGTDPATLRVLRPGSISAEELQEKTGVPVFGGDRNDAASQGRERSPGTRYRHYQPTVPVVAFHPKDWRALRVGLPAGASRAAGHGEDGLRAGDAAPSAPSAPLRFLVTPAVDVAPADAAELDLVRMSSPTEYAQRLYREFRRAEEDGVGCLYVELPQGPASAGLRDRILRAAGRKDAGDPNLPQP